MKKNILKKASIGIGLGLMLALPVAVLAALETKPVYISQPSDIVKIVEAATNWIAGFVLVFALIMLLWAAILFLTAGTSETAHTKAKNILIYAIVGIAVGLLAFSVVPLIKVILGGYY